MNQPPRVFLCYHHADAARAEELYDVLRSVGADPWLDKRKLLLGDNWEREIMRAVEKSDAFVVCLSTSFNDVGFRQKEVRWALETVKLRPPGADWFIIPFLLEPCDLPEWIRPLHAGEIDTASTVDQLVRAVAKHTNYVLETPEARTTTRMLETLPFAEHEEVLAIAKTLGRIGKTDKRAITTLTSFLRSPHRDVYQAARDSLSMIGPPAHTAVSELLATVDRESPQERRAFATVIGKIGPSAGAAADTLFEFMRIKDATYSNDKDSEDARKAAAYALRSINATEIVHELIAQLQSEAPTSREEAARFLYMISLPNEIVIPPLARALEDTEGMVRHYAAKTLAEFGPQAGSVLPAILAAFNDPKRRDDEIIKAIRAMGSAAASAVPTLLDYLRSEDHWHRAAVVDALGDIGVASAPVVHLLCDLLEQALSKPEPYDRNNWLCILATALGWLNAQEAEPLLRRAFVVFLHPFENKRYLTDTYLLIHHSPAWALAKLDPQSVETLNAIEAARAEVAESTIFRTELDTLFGVLQNGQPIVENDFWGFFT
jgi:HEAT repeat protein